MATVNLEGYIYDIILTYPTSGR